MSKRKHKVNNEQIGKREGNHNISQEEMIEIQSEAYYRALKRIESEKIEVNTEVTKKFKWYEYVFFVLNAIFFPWKINNKFNISNRIYDDVLVMLVSGALQIIGIIIWYFGVASIVYEIYQLLKFGVRIEFIIVFLIGVMLLFLGSTLILASNAFEKEKDSNRIYAYSASVIALISCVVSIIALLKT